MEQKFIIGDIVMYDNKIMVVKEHRDGCHFDLFCSKEGLVYCLVDIDEIKPVRLTPEILVKNGWKLDDATWIYKKGYIKVFRLLDNKTYAAYMLGVRVFEFHFIHQLQHFLFGLGLSSEMEV